MGLRDLWKKSCYSLHRDGEILGKQTLSIEPILVDLAKGDDGCYQSLGTNNFGLDSA
jgi:hypothetical protein